MSNKRYNATDQLLPTLARRERSLSWLARKVRVSPQLMWFVSRGERTLAEDKALRAAAVLDEEFDRLFVSTDASISSTVVEVPQEIAAA